MKKIKTFLLSLDRDKLLLLSLSIVLIGFLFLAFLYLRGLAQVTFVADDFSYARRINSYGFFGAQANWYGSWIEGFTGRIGSTLLVSLAVLNGPYFTGRVLMAQYLVTFVVFTGALYYFLKSYFISGNIKSMTAAIAVALVIMLSNQVTAPAVLQTTFWAPGLAIYYLPPYLLISGILMMFAITKTTSSQKWALLPALLLLLAALTSESMSILGFLLVAGLLYFELFMQRRLPWLHTKHLASRQRALIWSAVFMAMTFLIQYSAPGTFVRRAVIAETGTFINSIILSYEMTSSYIIRTIVTNWNTLFIVFITGLILGLAINAPIQIKKKRIKAIKIGAYIRNALLVVFGFSGLMLVPVHLAANTIPERSLMIVSQMLVIGFLLSGIALGLHTKVNSIAQLKLLTLVFIIVLVASLFTYKKALFYQVQALREYRKVMLVRDADIRNSDDLHVQVDIVLPNPYGLDDLSTNEYYWTNIEIARYYRKASIKLNTDDVH